MCVGAAQILGAGAGGMFPRISPTWDDYWKRTLSSTQFLFKFHSSKICILGCYNWKLYTYLSLLKRNNLTIILQDRYTSCTIYEQQWQKTRVFNNEGDKKKHKKNCKLNVWAKPPFGGSCSPLSLVTWLVRERLVQDINYLPYAT